MKSDRVGVTVSSSFAGWIYFFLHLTALSIRTRIKTLKRNLRIKLQPLLPDTYLRGMIFKQIVRSPSEDLIELGVAVTESDFRQCFGLLFESYNKAGFVSSEAKERSPFRLINFHQILPSTQIIVAKDVFSVVGTLSVYRDGTAGLPSEKEFDLTSLRSKYPLLVEFGSLAVAGRYRRENASANILFDLFAYAFVSATRVLQADAIVMSIYPEHVDFYRLAFDAQLVTQLGRRTYLGQPAVVVCIDCKKTLEWARHWANSKNRASWFFKRSVGNTPARYRLPLEGMTVSNFNLAAFDALLSLPFECRSLAQSLTAQEQKVLSSLISLHPELNKLINLESMKDPILRRSPRIDLNQPCFIRGQSGALHSGKLVELSEHGARVYLENDEDLQPNQEVKLIWSLVPYGTIQHEFVVKWRENRRLGLELVHADLNWKRTVSTLTKLSQRHLS